MPFGKDDIILSEMGLKMPSKEYYGDSSKMDLKMPSRECDRESSEMGLKMPSEVVVDFIRSLFMGIPACCLRKLCWGMLTSVWGEEFKNISHLPLYWGI